MIKWGENATILYTLTQRHLKGKELEHSVCESKTFQRQTVFYVVYLD